MNIQLEANNKTITISHSDKLLIKKGKVSKEDIARYYADIKDVIVPNLCGRPISMERCPDGIEKECFFQKELPDYFPTWVDTAHIPLKEEKKFQLQVVVNNAATLIYLADQGVITPHVWLSRRDKIEKPDRMIFDLDPPSGRSFKRAVKAARFLKRLLHDVGLKPYVMTSGGKGLHIAVPIQRRYNFDEVHETAKAIAQKTAELQPKLCTIEVNKEKRKGKVFIDYLRNSYAQTSVAPYAIRAAAGAPVAAPLEWEELSGIASSRHYTIRNIRSRISHTKDPWCNIDKHAETLRRAKERYLP